MNLIFIGIAAFISGFMTYGEEFGILWSMLCMIFYMLIKERG